MVESYTGIEPFTALGWFIIGLLYEEKDLLPSNCRIEVAAPLSAGRWVQGWVKVDRAVAFDREWRCVRR